MVYSRTVSKPNHRINPPSNHKANSSAFFISLLPWLLAGYSPRYALTESIHTRKEIFHNGHPTDIQHH